jgi:TRAP-type uncharacterized transport system substrate-binding protein
MAESDASDRSQMQRVAFRVGLVLLVTVGIGALTFFVYRSYPWLFRAQYTIRMAVPPLTASGDKFVAALRREMAVEYPRVQLTFIQTPDLDASADALKSGHADAAMVRSDNPMAAEGRTLVIVRKIAAIVILGPHTDATGWSDLKEKKIGVLTTSGQLDPLQKVLLDFYDVSERDIRLLAPNDVGPEVAGKNVAAVLAIGPAGPGTIADAARAIRIATKQAPKFLDFDEADAIMQRYPAYEKLDIPPRSVCWIATDAWRYRNRDCSDSPARVQAFADQLCRRRAHARHPCGESEIGGQRAGHRADRGSRYR